jgi:hypothetical protein
MNTILITQGKNCISVKNVINHFATGRPSKLMHKVMWQSPVQVICVRYVVKHFHCNLAIGAIKHQSMSLWIHRQ